MPYQEPASHGLVNKTLFLSNSSRDWETSSNRESWSTGKLTPEGYVICAVFLGLIILFGVINNLMVVIVIVRTKRLWTPVNVVLFNLSISDLCVSALGTPLCFLSAINGRWIFGEHMCIAYAFGVMLTGMAAIGTLVSVALLRLVVISKSFEARITLNASYNIVGLIWVYALVLALPPLFGWNSYVLEKPGIACSLNWVRVAQSPNDSSYVIFIFVFGYFVPVGVIFISYTLILWMLKEYPRMNNQSVVSKAEKQVTFMCVGMVVATLLTWTPYAIVSLISFSEGDFLPPSLSAVPALLAKASTVFNPVVYFYFNRQIRDPFIQMFQGLCQYQSPALVRVSAEVVTLGNSKSTMNRSAGKTVVTEL